MCFIKGIRLMNHSPTEKTVAPIHDEANTPTKNIKIRDVINPRPATREPIQEISTHNKKMIWSN